MERRWRNREIDYDRDTERRRYQQPDNRDREELQSVFDRGYDRVYTSREDDRDRDYDRGWRGRSARDRDIEPDTDSWRPQYPPAYDRGYRPAEAERGFHPREYQRDSETVQLYWDEQGRWRHGDDVRRHERGYRGATEYRDLDDLRDYRDRDMDPERQGTYAFERRTQGEGRTYGAGYGGSPTGRYAGVGPRGYQRSDARIHEEIVQRLTDHPHVDASDVDVTVDHGVVTVRGTVDNRRQKYDAEDEAEAVTGVREVRNEIRVQERIGAWTHSGLATGGLPGNLTEGMAVHASDGDLLGTVKEIRGRDFLLDRPTQSDVYVPFDYVRDVRDDRLILSVRSGDVDEMRWDHPSLTRAA